MGETKKTQNEESVGEAAANDPTPKKVDAPQKQLSEKLGINQTNISDWENDKSRPEYENLIKLADIFDVSLDDLLGRK